MAAVRRWDACVARPKSSARDGESDVWWHRVGSMIENDKGQIVVFLDSLPLPNERGVVQIMGFVPKEKEDAARPSRAASSQRPVASAAAEDDEIPF